MTRIFRLNFVNVIALSYSLFTSVHFSLLSSLLFLSYNSEANHDFLPYKSQGRKSGLRIPKWEGVSTEDMKIDEMKTSKDNSVVFFYYILQRFKRTPV